jgi:hypothetical protein
VSSATITAATGQLYLASVSMRGNVAVSSMSGLGLVWTRAAAQCSGGGTTRVEVWRAQGTTSTNGSVSATLAASANQSMIAVSRYSGVSTAAPVGTVISANSRGVGGACSGGTNSSSYSVNLTTTAAGSVAYGGVAISAQTHSAGSGFTERAEVHHGTGSGQSGVAAEDRTVASASTSPVNGTLSGNTDWAVIAVEIKR